MHNEEKAQTYTFQGRSMQEAVGRLKETLGPDAVIQGTRRARDKHGRYVEITARPGPQGIPVSPPIESGPSPVQASPIAAAIGQQLGLSLILTIQIKTSAKLVVCVTKECGHQFVVSL